MSITQCLLCFIFISNIIYALAHHDLLANVRIHHVHCGQIYVSHLPMQSVIPNYNMTDSHLPMQSVIPNYNMTQSALLLSVQLHLASFSKAFGMINLKLKRVSVQVLLNPPPPNSSLLRIIFHGWLCLDDSARVKTAIFHPCFVII